VSGLNLRGLRVDATPALTEKHVVKLGANTTADPVPATNPYSLGGNHKYTPGHSAPDPVPATAASQCDASSWRGAESATVDPVPARSY
jgi:hypothetical protein